MLARKRSRTSQVCIQQCISCFCPLLCNFIFLFALFFVFLACQFLTLVNRFNLRYYIIVLLFSRCLLYPRAKNTVGNRGETVNIKVICICAGHNADQLISVNSRAAILIHIKVHQLQSQISKIFNWLPSSCMIINSQVSWN